MIGKGQATYLQTLISQYAESISDLNDEYEYGYKEDDLNAKEAALSNAKRKLDNYIAKLTETDQ